MVGLFTIYCYPVSGVFNVMNLHLDYSIYGCVVAAQLLLRLQFFTISMRL
jgi:hypothetical protein